MALDGLLLRLLCSEMDSLTDCRIEKIHQPSRDELVLLLRRAGYNGRLLISAKSGFSRLQLTAESPDNPAEPPTFCKLLRKYIGGAKIVSFEQQGLDRTVFIRLSCYNEMGDRISPYLAVELFSNRSNIILCDENNRIIDAIHRSDIESGTRLIQPGARYIPLEPPKKLDPFIASPDAMADAVISSGKQLTASFTAAVDGVSPLVSRELAVLAGLDGDIIPEPKDKNVIEAALSELKQIITSAHKPTLISINGETKDFSYMPVTQYGSSAVMSFCGGYNELLERFYSLRDRAARLKAQSHDILRLLGNIRSRVERRLSLRLSELEESRDREHLRIYGELLKANLYAVPKGAEHIEVQNYYDQDLSLIKIPLNPAISPAANAAKYFKDYKKSHTAEQTLSRLVEDDRSELIYIDSVLDALSRAESARELADIRDELADAGYLFRGKQPRKAQPVSAPKEYRDQNGFRVLVGRNNRENDMLTLKLAGKEDIWLHTKDIAGSHVIVFTEGREVPEETIVFAARLAAANSKAAGSANVPVDCTKVKHVKKPSGSKPGMVIYTHNRTLYVTP